MQGLNDAVAASGGNGAPAVVGGIVDLFIPLRCTIATKGEHMVNTVSEPWKREHVTGRQFLETLLAWAAVLAVAGVVFAGLYFGIASLE